MINLEPFLGLAVARGATWSLDDFSLEAARYASLTGLLVDWDAGAGEGWARFLREGVVTGYLSVKLPLLIGDKTFKSIPHDRVIYVEAIPDTARLHCDPDVLRRVFGDDERLSGLESKSFTADDLWYMTV